MRSSTNTNDDEMVDSTAKVAGAIVVAAIVTLVVIRLTFEKK